MPLSTMMKKKLASRKLASRRYRRKAPLVRHVRQSHKVKYFTETFDAGIITVAPGGVGTRYQVRLADLANSASYRNLFSQYCILKFEAMLHPIGQNVIGSSPPPVNMYSSRNSDPSAAVPTTYVQLVQQDDCRIFTLDGRRRFSRTVRYPKPTLFVESLTAGTQVAAQTRGWTWLSTQDSSALDTYWAGLDVFYSNSDPNPVTAGHLFYKVTIAVKEQH